MNNKERTVFELDTLLSTLDLSDGDSSFEQIGGSYKDVYNSLKEIGKSSEYEVHHIPSRAVQDASPRELPSIALTKEDHALTDSFRGRQNSKYESFLPSGYTKLSYRDRCANMIEDGEYAELVRNEIYNIKMQFGDRYDGAIKEYLENAKEYISKNDVPKAVHSSEYLVNEKRNSLNDNNGSLDMEPTEKEKNSSDAEKLNTKGDEKMSNSFLESIKAKLSDKKNSTKKDSDNGGSEDSAPNIGQRERERNNFLDSIKVDPSKKNTDYSTKNSEKSSSKTSETQSMSQNSSHSVSSTPQGSVGKSAGTYGEGGHGGHGGEGGHGGHGR